jgi:hypothetical protein
MTSLSFFKDHLSLCDSLVEGDISLSADDIWDSDLRMPGCADSVMDYWNAVSQARDFIETVEANGTLTNEDLHKELENLQVVWATSAALLAGSIKGNRGSPL